MEFRIIRPGGAVRHVQARYELSYDDEENPLHMAGTLQDITELRALEHRLSHQALHDSITKLPNRALFQDRLGQALSRRLEGEIALLFVDLDNFKDVNDSLGHEIGDRVLSEVGARLRGCLRHEDTVARFGGDEFIVMLEGVKELSEACRAAERVTESLRAPFSLAGQKVLLTASIGISRSSRSHESPGDLIRDADVALHRAKEEGRARYEVFDTTMDLKVGERLNLVAELHQAVENEQLVLHYQPTNDLESGNILGLEALLRWEHPVRGMIPPAEFIHVAEETGMIRPIGRWALREACRQLKEWQDRGSCDDSLTMRLNLSARQFRHPDLSGEIVKVLEDTGLPPQCLTLELTESMLMLDAYHTVDILQDLKGLGVEISIDDFGTGYSNLAYLTRFPVDELKIDQSFVERLGQQSEDTAVIQTVIDLGGALKMDLVAEGVETAFQVSKLRELGCQRGQGYYFSEPMKALEAERLLLAESLR